MNPSRTMETKGVGLLGWAIAWLDGLRIDSECRRFGGVQKCPWCRRWSGGNWRAEPWERDTLVDKLTCASCGGTSLWKWEIGFVYLGALTPPEPEAAAFTRYDISSAALAAAEGRDG